MQTKSKRSRNGDASRIGKTGYDNWLRPRFDPQASLRDEGQRGKTKGGSHQPQIPDPKSQISNLKSQTAIPPLPASWPDSRY